MRRPTRLILTAALATALAGCSTQVTAQDSGQQLEVVSNSGSITALSIPDETREAMGLILALNPLDLPGYMVDDGPIITNMTDDYTSGIEDAVTEGPGAPDEGHDMIVCGGMEIMLPSGSGQVLQSDGESFAWTINGVSGFFGAFDKEEGGDFDVMHTALPFREYVVRSGYSDTFFHGMSLLQTEDNGLFGRWACLNAQKDDTTCLMLYEVADLGDHVVELAIVATAEVWATNQGEIEQVVNSLALAS